ncbi:hypothetical protein CLOP_g19129 [Closterium sp. NIES-67]|nr:hypothetical protein CLOP_g19129 [Closterium sp. NIES-67]
MARNFQTALLPLLMTLLAIAAHVTLTNTESQPVESQSSSSSSASSSSISRHVSLGSSSYSRQLYTVYMKALPPVISYHGGVDGLQATATAAATEEDDEEEEEGETAEEESVGLRNERSRRGEAGDYDYRDYYGDYRNSDGSDGGERRDSYKEGGDKSVGDTIKDRKGRNGRGRDDEAISAMQVDERRLQEEPLKEERLQEQRLPGGVSRREGSRDRRRLRQAGEHELEARHAQSGHSEHQPHERRLQGEGLQGERLRERRLERRLRAGGLMGGSIRRDLKDSGGGSSSSSSRSRSRAKASRPDASSAHVKAYAQHLRSTHEETLAAVGLSGSDLIYSYHYVANAFAARLTSDQVRLLKRHPSVHRISRARSLRPMTTHVPEFLQLPRTTWAAFGGARYAGENTVIGFVDSGIWPQHPSFSGRGYSGSQLLPGWRGVCNVTRDFNGCNNKIVGARYYMEGFLQEYGAAAMPKGEYMSPRDGMGHGTFCAGVAAGNAGVNVNYANLGSMSGVAPRARVAVYKAIWGGMSSLADVMAAVEDAVKDGVDVLSLAVGGTDDNYFNSIFLLRAVQAGVLVVAPAGNNGPPPTPTYWRTLTNVAPYILTVGASSIDREWSATLTLGNGTVLFGLTQTGGDGVLTANLSLIDSEEVRAKGAAFWEARQCRPGKIDRDKVGGALVVCNIGGVSPEVKARTVQDAGGRGMVLIPRNINESVRSVSGNFPVISFGYPKGVLIKSYIAQTASPTATLSHLVLEQPRNVRSPVMAYFSSSGPPYRPGRPYRPLPTVTNDVLKPDLVAPGLTILAAAAYGNSPGFSMQSGTSISSACVAGIAAMVMQKHPDWTPAAVKSALMTTARVKDAWGQPIQMSTWVDANPWVFGSGHIVPSRVLSPGLVYDVGIEGYINFLAGLRFGLTRGIFRPIKPEPVKPYMLNQPNIVIARLNKTVQVTRRVTNVALRAAKYTCSLEVPDGTQVKVVPSQFNIYPNQSVWYSVWITPTIARIRFSSGSITWSDGLHVVRSQLVVQPMQGIDV